MPRNARRPPAEPYNTGNAPVVASGGEYGTRQATEQSVAQAPLAGAGGSGGPPAPADPMTDAQNTPFQPVGLFAPTAQPGEPVTNGLPSGPGAGPEALMAQQNPDAEQLKKVVPLLEILASGPNSTHATRNFLRVLRSTAGT